MGETAENVARQWQVSREDQDKFALSSQEKYAAAHAAGKFLEEIVPVEIVNTRDPSLVSVDEHPRYTTLKNWQHLNRLLPGWVCYCRKFKWHQRWRCCSFTGQWLKQ